MKRVSRVVRGEESGLERSVRVVAGAAGARRRRVAPERSGAFPDRAAPSHLCSGGDPGSQSTLALNVAPHGFPTGKPRARVGR